MCLQHEGLVNYDVQILQVCLQPHLLQDWVLHHPHLQQLRVRLDPRGGAALAAVLRVRILAALVLQVVVQDGAAAGEG